MSNPSLALLFNLSSPFGRTVAPVAKLLIIVILGGALLGEVTRPEPQLLIDSSRAIPAK